MKISIITEGFQNTGYGHITRCLSLYQAFEERRIIPRFYINGDDKCASYLNGARFEIIDWLNHPAQLIKKIINSDFAIIDSYLAGREFYEKISNFCERLLIIDDNLRIDYPESIILNGTINAENFPYQKKTGYEFLLGSEYIPIRKPFWDSAQRKYNKEIKNILITFGGQDVRNLTIPVVKLVGEIYPEAVIHAVFGNKENGEIEKLKELYKDVKFYNLLNAQQIKELMLTADVVITAAGQTLYELAVTGTPSVAVVVADNQKNNILEWSKSGFLIEPIFYNEINCMKKIAEQLQKFKSIGLRKKCGSAGRKKVDGQGSRRVVSYLIERKCAVDKFYLRKAVSEDSEIVYELSNDPSVRSQSINKKPIEWDEHTIWFDGKIKDNNYLFLLAFDREDNFIGQIRFEIENNSAVVSISLTEKFRGKGLSKKIIKEGSRRLFNEYQNVGSITAYILPHNSASLRAFEAAGYKPDGEELINNELFKKFLLER
ncbi:acetyltransferase, GNAT family [Melioribacter roseus P3M-2]|uniref:Acetyltransferase, GNAT family n=1 Tax=Melioribacter roseus (strain DSM 23840 / JCM 17771 / VKM B-2668 / P3M-2) TaxID=1191523 RepID=I6YV40_MELRP|nr:bifunctional UDP-2,4-diacetamido-2,4,6-trideoxy-beta-L-altropyranose hydrolase/GNAT family N-acetyltransferase [Melioribacter roseus]AFN74397.1 acetyltransferase, GNAT family [Melioribacter roseus P3M-2]